MCGVWGLLQQTGMGGTRRCFHRGAWEKLYGLSSRKHRPLSSASAHPGSLPRTPGLPTPRHLLATPDGVHLILPAANRPVWKHALPPAMPSSSAEKGQPPHRRHRQMEAYKWHSDIC